MLMERMPGRCPDIQLRGVGDNLVCPRLSLRVSSSLFFCWNASQCDKDRTAFVKILWEGGGSDLFCVGEYFERGYIPSSTCGQVYEASTCKEPFSSLPEFHFHPLISEWETFATILSAPPETSSIFCAIWKKLVIASEQAHLVEFQDIAEPPGAMGVDIDGYTTMARRRAASKMIQCEETAVWSKTCVFLIDWIRLNF